MKFSIPATLNINELITSNPPISIKNFNKDYLLYIIDLITSIPACNKDLETINGFIPINSTLLQKRIRNYRLYLDYLLQCDVFETDNTYIKSKKSIGYKFTKKYESNIISIEVEDKKLIRHIKNSKKPSLAIAKKYNHLFCWYNDNLQINYNAAIDYITADLNFKLTNFSKQDLNSASGTYKSPQQQYNCSMHSIEKIAAGDFSFSIDNTVSRLHSVLSNIKSELRNYLTYNELQLVSIDIKNSQPYMSTILFNVNFWLDASNTANNNIATNTKCNKVYINNSILTFQDTIFDYKTFYSFVMLCKMHERLSNSDVQLYIDHVRNGTFYEYLESEISKRLNIIYSDRKQIKAAVFQVLFTDNRFIGQKDAKQKRIFKELFPTVYELFSMIKKIDKNNLPKLLQRIESHLMLLVITKRIAKENKSLPIFTIHDSIITTKGNESYVQNIMQEELVKAIGFAPQLDISYWCPSNLNNRMQIIQSNKKYIAA